MDSYKLNCPQFISTMEPTLVKRSNKYELLDFIEPQHFNFNLYNINKNSCKY